MMYNKLAKKTVNVTVLNVYWSTTIASSGKKYSNRTLIYQEDINSLYIAVVWSIGYYDIGYGQF